MGAGFLENKANSARWGLTELGNIKMYMHEKNLPAASAHWILPDQTNKLFISWQTPCILIEFDFQLFNRDVEVEFKIWLFLVSILDIP